MPEQHSAQPPPRFRGELGQKTRTGHWTPSPYYYASIISVFCKSVTTFRSTNRSFRRSRSACDRLLIQLFTKYVEYDFAADLEKLDDISGGGWIEIRAT